MSGTGSTVEAPMDAPPDPGGAEPVALLDLDLATYSPHAIHGPDRVWTETNCYLDVIFEMVHALGAEPLAAGGFLLGADFENPQWSFVKPEPDDLAELFGLRIGEMNTWAPVLDHVEEQLGLGRFLTIEVDSWWLPDTAGDSYRVQHQKTTIVPQRVDRVGRTLDYFHGRGYHRLAGEDFDEIFAPATLPPYVELVRLEGFDPSPSGLVERAVAAGRRRLATRPATNPVARMGASLASAIARLDRSDPEAYHRLAFGTCRQCGSTAEVAASYCRWLEEAGVTGMAIGAEAYQSVAEDAKAVQFTLARASRGRSVDPAPQLAAMATAWDRALDAVTAAFGS